MPIEPPIQDQPAPPLDEGVSSTGSQNTWGNLLGKKPMLMIRVFFQNVDGLSQVDDGEIKLQMLKQFKIQYEVDLVGLVETNTYWGLLAYEQQLPQKM